MGVAKTLWASGQGDPVFRRRVNRRLAIFWIVMIPLSMWQGLLNSIGYVSALSQGPGVRHWSKWRAARVEVRQLHQAQKAQQPDVPNEVVDAIIATTPVEAKSASAA